MRIAAEVCYRALRAGMTVGTTTVAAYALNSPIGAEGGAAYGCFDCLTAVPIGLALNWLKGPQYRPPQDQSSSNELLNNHSHCFCQHNMCLGDYKCCF